MENAKDFMTLAVLTSVTEALNDKEHLSPKLIDISG
jgi:hypothetical protein